MDTRRICTMLAAVIVCLLSGTACSAEIPRECYFAPYDPKTMVYKVTPEVAIKQARSWIGQPDLDLSLAGVTIYPGIPQADHYVLETPTRVQEEILSYPQQSFWVNCTTGCIERWRNYTPIVDNGNPLPDETVETSAISFARTHFPNFDSLSMVKDSKSTSGAYRWRQEPATGIRSDVNIVDIGVNRFTGEPVFYWGYNGGRITISLIPNLTSSLASDSAIQWCSSIEGLPYVRLGGTPFLCVRNDVLNIQRLAWYVPVVFSSSPVPSQLDYSTDVWVDAHNGEVISRVEWLGRNEPTSRTISKVFDISNHYRKATTRSSYRLNRIEKEFLKINGATIGELSYPPLLVNDNHYLYIGYILSPLGNAHFRWLNKPGFSITKGDRTYRMEVGRKSIDLGNTTLTISAAPRVINGRLYLPLDATALILDCNFRVVSDENAIDLIVPDLRKRISR